MLNNLTALLDSGAPAAVGDYESIQTYTVGAGGAANIEFTGISGSYKHLQIRFIARTARASFQDDNMAMQLNGNTGSNYAWHQLSGDGASATAGASTTTTDLRVGRITGSTAASGNFGAGVIDILDYANTNKYRTIRTLSGNEFNGSGTITFFSGLYQSTTAVTSIKLFSQTGANNFSQYSSFALYGVK
jgi:hypothetical protein